MQALTTAIGHALSLLLGGARAAAAFGTTAALVLGACGLALLVLGHRAYRPASAVVAAAGAALLGQLVLTELALSLPVTPAFALASFAVILAAAALAFPGTGALVLGAAAGLAVGRFAGAAIPADRSIVLLGATMAGGVVAGVFWTELPTLVPPLAGASLAAVAAWSLALQTPSAATVAELPAVWLGLAGVLAVMGVAIERTRLARREKAAQKDKAKDDAKSKERRDAEMRERYARYFQ